MNGGVPWSLILLTGGQGTRLGADKSNISVGRATTAQHIVGSIPAQVPIIVVGPAPDHLDRVVRITRESPPGGGPAAGVAAGLEHVHTDLVAVLATDMPFAAPVLADLMSAFTPEFDGVIALDESGREQYLCAVYRAQSLRSVLAGDTHNMAMYAALSDLRLHRIAAGERLIDIDTQGDLQRARELADSFEPGEN